MKNYVAKNFKILFVFVLILIVLTASNFLQINIYAENESDFCINAKSGILVDYSSGEVLFEQEQDGYMEGLTSNYIRVYIKNDGEITSGDIRLVKLVKLFKDGILGELI